MHTFARIPLATVLLLVISSTTSAADVPKIDTSKLVRLSPDHEIWVDKAHRQVIMTGEICRREGQMEMFACLRQTKEHESIVAVNTKAQFAHAGLIAVGAEPGNPAKFQPKYLPAKGTEIDVLLYWSDAKGQRQKARAQQWLRHAESGKEMQQPWVFGGSGFWIDRESGQRHYQAEEGDFICVSNFTTAMLDLPIESSQANNALLFEAFTERIPPRKTRVTVVLSPRLKDVSNERGGDPQVDLLPPLKKPTKDESS